MYVTKIKNKKNVKPLKRKCASKINKIEQFVGII